jgi:putative phosphoesterase
MVRIGIVSDTHKHIANLSSAVDFLHQIGATTLIHLGDDYTDVDEIALPDVIRVPGVFSDVYRDERIPNRIIKNIIGWRLLLSHTLASHPNDLPGDLRPEDVIRDRRADVVLFGHTHMPGITEEDGVIFINPGHLKNEDKRGFPPTFALVELSVKRMIARILRLSDHAIIAEHVFAR